MSALLKYICKFWCESSYCVQIDIELIDTIFSICKDFLQFMYWNFASQLAYRTRKLHWMWKKTYKAECALRFWVSEVERKTSSGLFKFKFSSKFFSYNFGHCLWCWNSTNIILDSSWSETLSRIIMWVTESAINCKRQLYCKQHQFENNIHILQASSTKIQQ